MKFRHKIMLAVLSLVFLFPVMDSRMTYAAEKPKSNGDIDIKGTFSEDFPGDFIKGSYGADNVTKNGDTKAGNWTISGTNANFNPVGNAACWGNAEKAKNCAGGTCGYKSDGLQGCATGSCWVADAITISNKKYMENNLEAAIKGGSGSTFNFAPQLTFEHCTGHDFTTVNGNMFVEVTTNKDGSVKTKKEFTKDYEYENIVNLSNIDKRHFRLAADECKLTNPSDDTKVYDSAKHAYVINMTTDFSLTITHNAMYCTKCHGTGTTTVKIKGEIYKKYNCEVNMAMCRDVIDVRVQKEDGTWPKPSRSYSSNWVYCASNTKKCWKCFTSKEPSDIYKDFQKELPAWNQNGDVTFYASGTHPSSTYDTYYDDNIPKRNSCCGEASCRGHYDIRSIYRRPTVDLDNILIMYSNKQSGSSTYVTSPYAGTEFEHYVTNEVSICTYDANGNASYTTQDQKLIGTWKDYNTYDKDFSLSVKGVIMGDNPPESDTVSTLKLTAPNASDIYSQVGYSVNKTFYKESGSSDKIDNNMSFDVTSSRTTTAKEIYAHWVSDPGKLTAIPNSTNTVNSAMAAHTLDGTTWPYFIHNSNAVKDSDYKSNETKLGFDMEFNLDSLTVENVTVKFNTGTGESADFTSYKTNVSFKGWKEAELGAYGYNTSSELPSCSLNSGKCTGIHGRIESLKYKFDNKNNNWTYSGSASHDPGVMRSCAVVATFEGSWKIVLPNAYKTGYLFKGWYSGDKCIGMAGDIIDLKSYVEDYNKNGYKKDGTCSIFKEDSIESETIGDHKFMSVINLKPMFEPLKMKVLYDMNIPADTDSTTSYGTVQSHTNVISANKVDDMHSYVKNGCTPTPKYTFGSTDPKNTHYSYIGSKTYTYDASDWNLEPVKISVNDYDFVGWKYKDVIWPGYGEIKPASGSGDGSTIINTVIGGTRGSAYDTTTDTLKTLKMEKNPVYNKNNNAPHTKSAGGNYKLQFQILNSSGNRPTNEEISGLTGNWLSHQAGKISYAQTDANAGNWYINYATGRNNCSDKDQCIYIVLEAQWDNNAQKKAVEYNSNNTQNVTKTDEGPSPSPNGAFSKYTDYVKIKPVSDSLFGVSNGAITSSFGAVINNNSINSSNTAVGDTSDDGSYDKNATSDSFIVNKTKGRYYSGKSNGRTGFFSFQGWSVWRYATWRDAIGSNKKDDPGWSELQPAGKDSNSINTTYTANSLTPRAYNDVERSKRAGDLYYRMASVLYNDLYNGGNKTTYNDAGSMLEVAKTTDTPNPKHPASRVSNIWEDYTHRWIQGSDGTYHLPMQLVTKENIKLYAVWDAYPTSKILNIYCDKDDIDKLTPAYLFSKVTAYDYEDFIYNKNYCIGNTSDGDVDWNTVCTASENMNKDNASECPAGDYVYTYKIKGDKSIMPGEFKATLVGYDYSRFSDVAIIDDIGAVSMTFRFEDSAGNMTFKTAWIYITDNDDDNYNKPTPTPKPNPNPDDPDWEDNNGGGNKNEADNTRYSTTRFISEDNYNKAEFDDDGNYIYGSARENDGALLLRSKWYMDESYKEEIQDAFTNLKAIGGSSLVLNFSPINDSLASNSGTGASLFDMVKPDMKAVWTGDYHPQLNEDGKWDYDWNKIAEKTVGIYRLEYGDIKTTKQLVRNQFDLHNTDKFEVGTMHQFLNKFRECAYKSLYGRPDPD